MSASDLISHKHDSVDFNLEIIESIKAKLKNANYLSLPLSENHNILQSLTEFELGRYLLMNGGLNGYWTQYIILGFQKKHITHPLESWLLNECPAILATRERFSIFQEILQAQLRPNMLLASIPCGFMDDLLRLDYSNAPECAIYGIDLDESSLESAAQNAQSNGIERCNFLKANAWDLPTTIHFDLITSNGLNIYEPDAERVISLYKEFFKALKPGGTLVISFLNALNDKNFTQNQRKQQAIFSDIIGVNWQYFRTEPEMRLHLQAAGFSIKDVVYDTQRIFPTIIANRP